ncbi:uncharacterized protein B0H18DRAFT_1009926 [Fomitopsis serialis]|uniref:uncharacterized protein n=1 Tax=Fomitopsis serialis TaxID=139415 RepID=UPI002008153F|nr:uncharacterized protein B0H18DRAFT_1009926 [Neoantrodia serialis]KAH9925119.1 hypothetical protein B0H18DRAFT_1009926 [Neoantrodia serialis]
MSSTASTSSATLTYPSGTSTGNHRAMPNSEIAGLAVGIAVSALLAVAMAWYLIQHWRRMQAVPTQDSEVLPPEDPEGETPMLRKIID